MKRKRDSAETKPVSTQEADRILKEAAAREGKRLRLSENGKAANGQGAPSTR
jgi:hypothetical protein